MAKNNNTKKKEKSYQPPVVTSVKLVPDYKVNGGTGAFGAQSC